MGSEGCWGGYLLFRDDADEHDEDWGDSDRDGTDWNYCDDEDVDVVDVMDTSWDDADGDNITQG